MKNSCGQNQVMEIKLLKVMEKVVENHGIEEGQRNVNSAYQ